MLGAGVPDASAAITTAAPVSPTGFDAGQERFRKNLGSPVVGKKWLRTPTSHRLGPFRDRRSLPEHGADRAVPLAPRISTHLARSSGSHTNSDTLVGMPCSSV